MNSSPRLNLKMPKQPPLLRHFYVPSLLNCGRFLRIYRANTCYIYGMNERAITTKALNQLAFQTGIVGRVSGFAPAPEGCDQGEALIKFDKSNAKLIAELRKWDANGGLGKVVDQVTEGYQKLLICDYISDEEGARLRESKINYLDNVGNAYLDIPPVYVLIQGKKPKDSFALDRADKLFTETGLKVILALLANKDLLNANYRKIADHANVSMGTIGWVLRELKHQGYTGYRDGQVAWKNRGMLVKKWVDEYPCLKEKNLVGVYYTSQQDWWQTIKLDEYEALLGGQIAGVDYQSDFVPESGEIFVGKHKQGSLVRDLQLLEADQPQGKHRYRIEVYKKFWGMTEEINLFDNLVHPLISYASLMDTWHPISRELASKMSKQINK